jgi:hypothetical protein
MASDVAQWYALVECNRGMLTWEELIKLVNQCFGSSLRGNVLGKLIQLRWESSIADYQSKFILLLAGCEGLLEKDQINIFMADLCIPLKTDVIALA